MVQRAFSYVVSLLGIWQFCLLDTGVGVNGICRAGLPLEAVQKLRQTHRHKMAVIIPYRDRLEMLNKILPSLHSFLKVESLLLLRDECECPEHAIRSLLAEWLLDCLGLKGHLNDFRCPPQQG